MERFGPLAGLVVASVLAASCGRAVEQPVPFSHSKHAALKIDCEACHTGAKQGVHAGIPRTDSCALCHRPERVFPPNPGPLAAYLATGREIPWQQVHAGPRHVYFSHHRHVTLAKIECSDCHGLVETMDSPFIRPVFEGGENGMNRCVDCHRKEKVTTDCLSCHR